MIDNQKVTDLPNMGRNPFMLSKIVQNVIPVGNPAYNRMEDQTGSSQISIAGGPVRGNNYLLDGIPITDADNRAIIIPSLEAVQEVKIQANTYDAEMARTGGGMFNTLMKSGTNEYHGSALWPHSAQRTGCQQLLQQRRGIADRVSPTRPGARASAVRSGFPNFTTVETRPSSILAKSTTTTRSAASEAVRRADRATKRRATSRRAISNKAALH